MTTQRSGRTTQGYWRFRCQGCERGFNERTGTALNRVQVPTDIVFLVVLWRLRYKLSLQDLAEIFLIRGLVFTHEAVRDWEAKLAPLLAEALQKRRTGKIGRSWYADETYVKFAGAKTDPVKAVKDYLARRQMGTEAPAGATCTCTCDHGQRHGQRHGHGHRHHHAHGSAAKGLH